MNKTHQFKERLRKNRTTLIKLHLFEWSEKSLFASYLYCFIKILINVIEVKINLLRNSLDINCIAGTMAGSLTKY